MTGWLGVFLGVALGCGASAQTPVILISIDTLRADHLSSYGYKGVATPNIDVFAQHGTLFTRVDAQIPLTLPSHTALMTSTYPFQSGVEENGEVLPASAVTLASILQARGYKTAAFIGSNILARGTGFERGFDEYDSPFGAVAAAEESPYSSRVRRDGALVLRAATQWLAAHRGQSVFAFVHLFDLHAPYRLQPSAGSALPSVAGYDAELKYVDQILGRFRQTLEKDGWWQKALVVLLADHGEGLGDHGESSHGYFAYESTLHVPLFVHWPEGSPVYPARSEHPAGLIDVAPTILDALHFPATASFVGSSLLKFEAHPVYSEAVYTRDEFGWAPLRVVRSGQFKLIEAPHAELYGLDRDPRERTNLERTDSAEASSLRAELSRLVNRYARAPAPAIDMSKGTREALQSLGYLGDGQRRAQESGPDPKDRLAEYQLFEKALDAFYNRRLAQAIADLRRVLTMDKANGPAADALAEYEKIQARAAR
jgi:arylsulfatase A-like enzyme